MQKKTRKLDDYSNKKLKPTFIEKTGRIDETWYNIRKGQSKMSENTYTELARADAFSGI